MRHAPRAVPKARHEASPVGWATLALMGGFAAFALIDGARRRATVPLD